MRRILIVVDMQHDFIDGALGTPEARAIVPAVVRKKRNYARRDIFATRDTHEENYLQTQEGRNLPVPHCRRGTKGWQLLPEIAAGVEADHLFDKPTFGSEALAAAMKERAERAPLTIELVGVCTDICVVSNALLLKAALPETAIFVDPDCCAGVTPAQQEAALTTLQSCQIRLQAAPGA